MNFLNNFQSLQKAEIRKHIASFEALTETALKHNIDREVEKVE